jgi:uncharacterized protein (TIGR03084 family)
VIDAVSLAPLLGDLAAEHAALDALVASIDEPAWDTPTPAFGWSVRDQIGHLTYFDGAAVRAIADPRAFVAERDAFNERPSEFSMEAEARVRSLPPATVLAEWRSGREALLGALSPLDPKARIEWYGPPMSARSFATARIMETWAHGLDVADALGATHPATARLRHVAHLGVVTRGWTFAARGMPVPRGDVRVELMPPGGGDEWTWGGAAADDRVVGSALEFCQVVTQRRLLADTGLRVEGPLATGWMARAQAFAGPPTTTDPARRVGRQPGPG